MPTYTNIRKYINVATAKKVGFYAAYLCAFLATYKSLTNEDVSFILVLMASIYLVLSYYVFVKIILLKRKISEDDEINNLIIVHFLVTYIIAYSLSCYSRNTAATVMISVFLSAVSIIPISAIAGLLYVYHVDFTKIIRFVVATGKVIIIYVVTPYAVIVIMYSFIFSFVQVVGKSMNNTLNNGDIVIVNRLGFNTYIPFISKEPVSLARVDRGSIVVFELENTSIIKRCVGITDDVVTVRSNKQQVYLNGKIIKEKYLAPAIEQDYTMVSVPDNAVSLYMMNCGAYKFNSHRDKRGNILNFKVPEKTIFVLGDNRDNSVDSSAIGPIPLSRVSGIATYRIFNGKSKSIVLDQI